MPPAQPDLHRQYSALLRRFGPQGWWPVYRVRATAQSVDVPEKHGRVFLVHPARLVRCPYPKRLTEADRFQICVGAILTQNTAWRNVEGALTNLFSPPLAEGSACPPLAGEGVGLTTRWSPQWFAWLPRPKLASLIRPAGYFNQKAKKLQIFSRWLLHEYGGSLSQFFRLSTEDCRLQLLSLWGIGPETADSILLYAGRHPVFVIDAYTRRWLQSVYRLRTTDYGHWTYDDCQRFFMERLPHDALLFNKFHALIVAWGKHQVHPERATRVKDLTTW